MDQPKLTDKSPIDGVVQLLRQILQLYKEMGPQSMESLTKSYLSSAPAAETAQDAAEGMLAQAFKIFDKAVDSVLQASSRNRCFHLKADLFKYFVDLLDTRLNVFFSEMIKGKKRVDTT